MTSPLHLCVDPEGFEPSTFSMPLRRAPNCAMGPHYFVTVNTSFQFIHCSLPSGPEGIRTPGLLSAIEARSQLRYRPIYYPAHFAGQGEAYSTVRKEGCQGTPFLFTPLFNTPINEKLTHTLLISITAKSQGYFVSSCSEHSK